MPTPELDQSVTPLFEAMRLYARRQPVPLHVPGHKQGRSVAAEWRRLLGRGLQLDLTEAPGLDDLHAPEGPIAQAQALAADAFGAAHSYFLVGGSTAGIHAMILSACRPGDTLLVPRHAHRSVFGALVLAGARPAYLQPIIAPGLDLPLGITPAELRRAVVAHPEATAVLLVHPTYAGHVSPLEELCAIAHGAGLMVLVDEAHGAHFGFHPGLPSPALSAGADASVQSLHKLGGSLTQSAILHLGSGGGLDPQRVQEMLRLVQTSSPSYLLMASLDLARRELALNGRAAWERALRMAADARRRLARLHGIACPGANDLGSPVIAADPAKLLIEVRGRCSGFTAAAHLWERHGVAVEMAAPGYLLAVLSPGDRRRDIDRLVRGVADLPAAQAGVCTLGEAPWPEVVLAPRDAFLARKAALPLDQAAGEIAAELVAPYPPGIPVLAPGERITPAVANYLRQAVAAGYHLQGPAEPTLRTITVVKE